MEDRLTNTILTVLAHSPFSCELRGLRFLPSCSPESSFVLPLFHLLCGFSWYKILRGVLPQPGGSLCSLPLVSCRCFLFPPCPVCLDPSLLCLPWRPFCSALPRFQEDATRRFLSPCRQPRERQTRPGEGRMENPKVAEGGTEEEEAGPDRAGTSYHRSVLSVGLPLETPGFSPSPAVFESTSSAVSSSSSSCFLHDKPRNAGVPRLQTEEAADGWADVGASSLLFVSSSSLLTHGSSPSRTTSMQSGK